ncbi:MAG: twin-arginine translocase subunit TatC [Acidobacteria bacterium]|nr:twin-arginine translocase subunit TatC [Acidobacteriota bacterium]
MKKSKKKTNTEEKAPKETQKEELPSMSLLEHIEDLRQRLFRIVGGVVVGFFICWGFAEEIYDFLSRPLQEILGPDQKLVFTKIQSPFILYMKVALLAGFFLAMPWILYQVWKFISPGLYKKERRMVFPFVFFTTIAFGGGVVFGYYVMFPNAFSFLLNVGAEFQPMLSVDDYFSLVNRLLLALGLVFELPILIYFLSKLGLVTHRFLIKNMHWAIIMSVILGAVLTPPDVFSQIMLAAPLLLLYCLGILISFVITRNREKKA